MPRVGIRDDYDGNPSSGGDGEFGSGVGGRARATLSLLFDLGREVGECRVECS